MTYQEVIEFLSAINKKLRNGQYKNISNFQSDLKKVANEKNHVDNLKASSKGFLFEYILNLAQRGKANDEGYAKVDGAGSAVHKVFSVCKENAYTKRMYAHYYKKALPFIQSFREILDGFNLNFEEEEISEEGEFQVPLFKEIFLGGKYNHQKVEVKAEPVEVVFLLDGSGSMDFMFDRNNTRMDIAKTLLCVLNESFIQTPNIRMVVYSHSGSYLMKYEGNSWSAAQGNHGTMECTALGIVLNQLETSDKKKLVVILSDGDTQDFSLGQMLTKNFSDVAFAHLIIGGSSSYLGKDFALNFYSYDEFKKTVRQFLLKQLLRVI